jgi:hypothetical protein
LCGPGTPREGVGHGGRTAGMKTSALLRWYHASRSYLGP